MDIAEVKGVFDATAGVRHLDSSIAATKTVQRASNSDLPTFGAADYLHLLALKVLVVAQEIKLAVQARGGYFEDVAAVSVVQGVEKVASIARNRAAVIDGDAVGMVDHQLKSVALPPDVQQLTTVGSGKLRELIEHIVGHRQRRTDA